MNATLLKLIHIPSALIAFQTMIEIPYVNVEQASYIEAVASGMELGIEGRRYHWVPWWFPILPE